jgi:hypothetical protein
MRAAVNRFILSLILALSACSVFSQGCNDAGLCTMGDIRQNAASDSGKFLLSGIFVFRLGEKNSANLSLIGSATVQPWKAGKFSLQLPFVVISGNLGTITGPGDIAFDLSKDIWKRDSSKISITIGGKVPLTDANRFKNGEPLPMAYQTSQGTWDGIAGISLFLKRWHFSFACQHNFNASKNMYLSGLDTRSNEFSYFNSRKIDRGDDVLFRIEREFRNRGKSRYFFGVLPIYRIQEATIEDLDGKRVPVEGSSGLTINMNAGYTFTQGSNKNIKVFLGAPVITRHIRPDGLTGTFVIGVSMNWLLQQ